MKKIKPCPVCGQENTRNSSARTCNDPKCVALSKRYSTLLNRINSNKYYDHKAEMVEKLEKGKFLSEEDRLIALSTVMQEK